MSPREKIARAPRSPSARPPIVSPHLSLASPSWDDDRRSLNLAPRYRPLPADRSVVSESMILIRPDADMPLDEFEADVRSVNSSRTSLERKQEIRRLAASRLHGGGRESPLPTPTLSSYMEDDVSSLGGVEDQTSAVQRMTLAIRSKAARPSGLTREERALWDAVQTVLRDTTKSDQAAAKPVSPDHATSWQVKYDELKERAAAAERDHQSALRAIQRVLADVTAERDKAVRAQSAHQCPSGAEERVRLLELELGSKNSRIKTLELQVAAQQAPQTDNRKLQLVQLERDELAKQLKACQETMADFTRRSASPDSSSEVEHLRRELAEKTSTLENAKMIIASLESASGSLAADLRNKLKSKEEELISLKVEASDRQRKLDNMAAQLRDMQHSQQHQHRSVGHRQRSDEERSRRLALSSRLEKNMADMRAASVVLESTNDPGSLDQVTNLLADSINALKSGIDVIDEAEDSSVDGNSIGNDSASYSSRSSIPMDSRKVRKELEERTRALHRVEDALRKQKEELTRLRSVKDEEHEKMRQEIQSLREQCQTNLEVLTRKERELAVLRDSLKVDDGVGYISDDGTDATESDGEAPVQSVVAHYGPSQAEALATLLAHGGGGNKREAAKGGDTGEMAVFQRELMQARAEMDRARKQLKTEKESLANAKMIISSLEKANKSMMEDLRSRLQDSNTAIASLLEKSMESEKTTAVLRAEIEALRREKDKEKTRFEAELDKLRPGASSNFDASVRKDGRNPVEEKKDDISLAETVETID